MKNKFVFSLFAFILLLAFNQISFASVYKAAKFDRIKYDSGFIPNSITNIQQDSIGYLWIGTRNGLFKFDGFRYSKYNYIFHNSQAIIENEIYSIHVDSKKRIWTSSNNGLNIYKRDIDAFKSISYFFSTEVRKIVEIKTDVFLVHTRNSLFLMDYTDPNNPKFKNQTHLKITVPNISNIYLINNTAWISSGSELYRVDVDGVSLNTDIILENLNINNSSTILTLNKFKSNKILVGTINGLIVLKSNNKVVKVRSTEGYTVRSICKDYRNNYWLGTQKGVIVINDDYNIQTTFKKEPFNKHSIGSNFIKDLFEDRYGVMWVGTVRGGLCRYIIRQKGFEHVSSELHKSNTLAGNVINAIHKTKDNVVWVGTFNNGLTGYFLKNRKKQFFNFKNSKNKILASSKIFDINSDSSGNLWIGTLSNGLFFISSKDRKLNEIKKFTHYPEICGGTGVTRIHISTKGTVWLASFSSQIGLVKVLNSGNKLSFEAFKKEHVQKNSISNNRISDIFSFGSSVWVSYNNHGISRIALDSTDSPINFRHFDRDIESVSTICNNKIFNISMSSNGDMWFGSFGNGLFYLPANEINKQNPVFSSYTIEQGLPDNVVYSIIPINNELWISTNNGLSKFNIISKKFKNFNIHDNIQEHNFRRFAAHKDYNGKLYFGGINGFNEFFPGNIKNNSVKPNIEISSFRLFNKKLTAGDKYNNRTILNKDISVTQKITLPYNFNSFSIGFSALHFVAPSENSYLHKLEGADKDWVSTDKNIEEAYYSHIRPGVYTFKVKAANLDGLWNDVPASIVIEILPPIWLTKTAYFIYLILFIAALYIFYRYAIKKQMSKNKVEIARLEKEKIEEINKVKLNFFTNISHEFKTPLTLILGPLENIMDSKFDKKVLQENLNIINYNANRLLKLVNQLMDFRKIESEHLKFSSEKTDLVLYIKTLVHAFKEMAKSRTINIRFCSVRTQLLLMFDKDKIEKIFYNIIFNALKYSDEGVVEINVSDIKDELVVYDGECFGVRNNLDKFVEVRVSDTGLGIEAENLPKIFQKFYSENSNEFLQKGSGIGLEFSKLLVEAHKGCLSVISEKNVGTTFIVRLAVQEDILVGNPHVKDGGSQLEILSDFDFVPFEKNEDSISSSGQDMENVNLPIMLVVDDNRDIRKFLKGHFASRFKIIEAKNGQEALDIAKKSIPDIIISDVMMPVMDGIEFCKFIKSNEITNHIPVVLLTARGAVEHRIEGLEVGADSYIPKPFSLKHLLVRIEKLLELRHTLRSKYLKSTEMLEKLPDGMSQRDVDFITKVEEVINENLSDSDFTVKDLESQMAYSRMQLYRKLKTLTGFSANEFIRDYRLRKAAEMFRLDGVNVTEVLYAVGISNHSYFTKCFKKKFDKSPKEYIKFLKES